MPYSRPLKKVYLRRWALLARWVLIVVLLPGLVGCSTLTIPQERKLGKKAEREIRRELDLIRDKVVVGYVQDIGRRIVSQVEPQPYDYHFRVVDDEDINAFALPAGYIFINTGTILKSRNAGELTGVIAHEIAHVSLRHVAESYNRQRSTGVVHQILILIAGIFGGSYAAGAANLGGGLAGTMFLNSFTREAEAEADAFAAEMMPKAKIDPEGLVTFFETLENEGGPGVPSFLSSHPTTESRIEETRALIDGMELPDDLRTNDGGRLEIIQRRIQLLTGEVD